MTFVSLVTPKSVATFVSLGRACAAAALLAAPVTFAGPALESHAVRAASFPVFDAQGHRGARGLFPENAWPAFDAALSIGVTTLEMDTVVTADGVVVVHHDRRLHDERTRDANGAWLSEPAQALKELPFAALADFDVGRARPNGRVARRFPDQQGSDGVRIPALSDILRRSEDRTGGAIRYNIETKLSPLAPGESPDPETFARLLVETIHAAGIKDGRAAVQSFDWRTLQAVQKLAPEIPTVYLSAERSWLDNIRRRDAVASPWTAGTKIGRGDRAVPRAVAKLGGSVWSPYYRDLTDGALRAARKAGVRVVVWTVNKPKDMAALIDRGVDGIITDYPDRLRRVMADKGLPLPPAY